MQRKKKNNWVRVLAWGSDTLEYYLQGCDESILTAEFDDPAPSQKTQEGGEGGGHVSIRQHNMAYWRERTDTNTQSTGHDPKFSEPFNDAH